MSAECRTMSDEPNMKERELRHRTKAFALRVIQLCSSLPQTNEARVLGRQLLRSGTSVGALP